jgi:hypothetical protein
MVFIWFVRFARVFALEISALAKPFETALVIPVIPDMTAA